MGPKTVSEIILVLQSHSQRYGDVQVIFSKFYLALKWPAQVDFLIICSHKNSYLIYGGDASGLLLIYILQNRIIYHEILNVIF